MAVQLGQLVARQDPWSRSLAPGPAVTGCLWQSSKAEIGRDQLVRDSQLCLQPPRWMSFQSPRQTSRLGLGTGVAMCVALCCLSFSFHIFNGFLNKRLSLYKKHCSAHLGRRPSSAGTSGAMAVSVGGASLLEEQQASWPHCCREPGTGLCATRSRVQRTPSEHSWPMNPGWLPLEVSCHTTESRISEPRRTRGRGHTGDTSTKLSWMLSGLFSDSVKTWVPGELSDRAW